MRESSVHFTTQKYLLQFLTIFHAATDPQFWILHEVLSSHLLSLWPIFFLNFSFEMRIYLKAYLKECEKLNMGLQLVQTFYRNAHGLGQFKIYLCNCCEVGKTAKESCMLHHFAKARSDKKDLALVCVKNLTPP